MLFRKECDVVEKMGNHVVWGKMSAGGKTGGPKLFWGDVGHEDIISKLIMPAQVLRMMTYSVCNDVWSLGCPWNHPKLVEASENIRETRGLDKYSFPRFAVHGSC